jgi:hypothetical protein
MLIPYFSMALCRTLFSVYEHICITKVFGRWPLAGVALYRGCTMLKYEICVHRLSWVLSKGGAISGLTLYSAYRNGYSWRICNSGWFNMPIIATLGFSIDVCSLYWYTVFRLSCDLFWRSRVRFKHLPVILQWKLQKCVSMIASKGPKTRVEQTYGTYPYQTYFRWCAVSNIALV